jgi:two-component system, NarL family, sensor kinase
MGTQESKVYLAILIAVAVIAVILIYFTVTIFRQQKNNFTLHLSKIQAEITTLEKERLRMSRDLHDDIAPMLLRVKYNISGFDFTDISDIEVQEQSNSLLDQLIDRLREVSHDLIPAALERKGLIPALEELTDTSSRRTGLQISFRCGPHLPPLAREKEVHLFRVVQEILHNTIKHAYAKNFNVEIKSEGKLLYLLTEDNGTGFDYSLRAKDFTGIGLRSLLNRADVLGGKMYLDSKAGKGTRYIFEIPI